MAIPEESAAPSLDEPETRFLLAVDDMVACAQILEGGLRTITFKKDMMKVWGVIYVITRELNCWTYVKSSHRKRYGSKAYRDLWDLLSGPYNVDNIASEAERLLVATRYSGERKRFNFECYTKIQKYQHHILEGLK